MAAEAARADQGMAPVDRDRDLDSAAVAWVEVAVPAAGEQERVEGLEAVAVPVAPVVVCGKEVEAAPEVPEVRAAEDLVAAVVRVGDRGVTAALEVLVVVREAAEDLVEVAE